MADGEDEPEAGLPCDTGPPDGGWGWLVMVAALMINVIYDGCSYSFGILFVEFIDYFGDSKSKTAWIGSLFFSIPLLFGPIAQMINVKIGPRTSAMIGGAVAATGFVAGSFSTSTEMLCLTYGLLSGLGMSLPYLTTKVVVAQYFDKRLALATGIAECGAGVGTIIFAPLTEHLLQRFSWRGSLLILGGIMGNIVVCGALFRPLTTTVNRSKARPVKEQSHELLSNRCNGDKLCTEVCASSDGGLQEEVVLTVGNTQDKDHCEAETNYVDSEIGNISSIEAKSEISLAMLTNSTADIGRPLNSTRLKHRTKSEAIKLWIIQYMCDTKLLKTPGYTLMVVQNFVMYFWYDVPYVFLVDRATDLGISLFRATFLVFIIGIFHTVGNIIYGVIGDWKLNKTILYSSSIILCGVSVAVVPCFNSYIPLAVLAGCFGLFSAANEALCTIILVRVVGQENLNQAFGLIMLLQGIGNLVGPPFAGWLYDVSGSFTATFVAAGVSVVFAGILYLFHPCVRKKIDVNGEQAAS